MKAKLTIGVVVMAAVGLAALVGGIYWALTTVDGVLLWAIGATALVPLAAVAGWAVGRYEVTALLHGIDLGAGQVVNVAERIADIKDRKQPSKDVTAIDVRLLPPTVYRELPAGDGDVVDL